MLSQIWSPKAAMSCGWRKVRAVSWKLICTMVQQAVQEEEEKHGLRVITRWQQEKQLVHERSGVDTRHVPDASGLVYMSPEDDSSLAHRG